MRCGVVPYGFAYLEGKLAVDPRETKVVHQMVKLWQSGKSYKAIAERLNDQKIPTRLGKRWTHSVIKAVIKRHLEQKS
jgi:hypothetical protein